MKKSLTILLLTCAFAMVLALAGCGGSSASGSAASTSAGAASNSTANASASASASASADDPGLAEYNRAAALFDAGKFYSAKVAFEKSQYKDWEQRAAACVQPMPATGEIYHNEAMTSDKMALTFTVNDEESDTGRYITVLTEGNESAVTLFIVGSDSVETWLPGGSYYVKHSWGTEWYGTDEQFGPNGNYETMVFDEVQGNRYLTVLEEGYAWAITIHSVAGAGGQDVGSESNGWEDRA